jgi:hypothetical protein
MNKRDIRIRSLSEGIGLGSLKPSAPKVSLTEVEPAVMRQAHAAYAPHSVETEIRRQPTTKGYVHFVRFMSDTGVDFLVGVVSFFMIAWIAIIAWNVGESGHVDILGALSVLVNFLTMQSWSMLSLMIVMIGLTLRLCRYLLAKIG